VTSRLGTGKSKSFFYGVERGNGCYALGSGVPRDGEQMLCLGFLSSKRGGIDAMLGVPEFLERGNRCYALGSGVPGEGE
jgi:hypothetical protein